MSPTRLVLAAVALLLLPACAVEMDRQPRFDPLEASSLFPDGTSARAPVPGTVPRDPRPPGPLDEGIQGLDRTPLGTAVPYTRELLERGRVQFEVNCAPCHGLAGYGDGMVVRRGFPAPPSFHDPRLREAPDAHFWSVMTNGLGLMSPYADRLTPAERWEVVAWIRALQLSQATPLDLLSPDERRRLEELR